MKKIQFFSKHREKKQKEGSSGGFKEFVAKLSRGLMLPIAMLPIAGLFLGIGSAIVTNASDGALKIFGEVIKAPGNVIFGNLAVLFAIAIAITFTGDIGVAGLSSFVGWIVFCALQNACIFIAEKDTAGAALSYNFLFYHLDKTMFGAIFTDNVGIKSLCTSVFGGLTVGFVTAFLYNKFKNIQLPTILGFFSGVRFIPIVTFLSMIPLSMLFGLIWPGIGMGLYYMGVGLGQMGRHAAGFNSFIFGYIERALVPFGLHHAFYTPLWYTSVGGQINLDSLTNITYGNATYDSIICGGVTYDSWSKFIFEGLKIKNDNPYQGDQTCWFFLFQIAGKSVDFVNASGVHKTITLTFDGLSRALSDGSVNVGQYMQGKYSFMMFALPAAAAAMIMVVPKEGNNRKMALSVIGSAALTSFLTGITEPLEFTFLFLAPWLYWGFHAFFCAVSFWMMNLVGAHMGMTFSGGFIDFMIYGALPDGMGAGANCYWAIIFGLILAPIYFFGFYFLIKKFDIKTPGREGNEIKLLSKKDYLASKEGNKGNSQMNTLSNAVIKAYGGKQNIVNVDACITKLRVQVKDSSKVNKQELMNLGAKGVVNPSKQSVYAVFGTQADIIKNEMKAIIAGNAPTVDVTAHAPVQAQTNTKAKKINTFSMFAPVDGQVVSTKKVKDETFSEDIMGKGFAIIPANGTFVSPVNGTITLVNNHAIGIKADNGLEILIHIGIDTVKLSGKNVFKHYVNAGKHVKIGDKLVDADLALIKKNKLDTITPVIVLNESIGNNKINLVKTGKVKKGQMIVSLK